VRIKDLFLDVSMNIQLFFYFAKRRSIVAILVCFDLIEELFNISMIFL